MQNIHKYMDTLGGKKEKTLKRILLLLLPNKFLNIVYHFCKHYLYDRWSTKQRLTEELCTNLEGEKQMDFSLEGFEIRNKKHGISGIARLHNSAEFLEPVIKSHLPIFDEIILINNVSEDATKEICLRLQQKYPEKIRYLEYPYKLAWALSDKHEDTPENSLHSCVYYSNWCFAQAQYKIVCKIDDDNLFIPEWSDPVSIRKKVLAMKENTYLFFSGKNILSKNGKYEEMTSLNRYSGIYGDIGFYYQDEYSYFKKVSHFERPLIRHKKKKWLGFVYIHLKFLKQAHLPSDEYYTNPEDKHLKVRSRPSSEIDALLRKKI